MAQWSGGYVSDVAYVPGFYPEQSPEFIRLAMLVGGVMPSALGAERPSYCELGFGNGLGISLLAAANPALNCFGNDFMPEHVAFARELGRDLSNLHLFEDSFEEFAARDDLPDFDFITLHGIWSWVSAENQRHILDFARRRLKPGGALYIGYNAQPGWHVLAPLKGAIAIHAQLASAAGASAIERAQQAMQYVRKLQQNAAQTIVGNRAITERIEKLNTSPAEYVAHEYLNAHWQPLYFSDVAEALAQAKLSYVATSKLLRMLDNLNLTPEARQHVSSIANPALREVTRDYYAASPFRQDVFARGARRLQVAERDEMLGRVRLVLLRSAADVSLKFTTPLGETALSESIYKPVLDLLDRRGCDGATVAELQETAGLRGKPAATALEVATILAGTDVATPIFDPRTALVDDHPARAFNRRLFEFVNAGHRLHYVASPITHSAHALDRISALLLQGYEDGAREVGGLAERAWKALQRMGHRMMKDGKPIESPEENLAQLRAAANEFLDRTVPNLKRIGVLPA
jgi:SAM-dependent methyltransferase